MDVTQQGNTFVKDSGKDLKERLDNWYKASSMTTRSSISTNFVGVSKREEEGLAIPETLVTKEKIAKKKKTQQRDSDSVTRPYSANDKSSQPQLIPEQLRRINDPRTKYNTPVEVSAWAKEVVQMDKRPKIHSEITK